MLFEFQFSAHVETDASDEDLEAHLDDVTSELLKLSNAIDSTVSGSITERTVLIEFRMKASSLEEASAKGSEVVRSAIHAAGGSTPDWPSTLQPSTQWDLQAISGRALTAA